jgi:fucose permease
MRMLIYLCIFIYVGVHVSCMTYVLWDAAAQEPGITPPASTTHL